MFKINEIRCVESADLVGRNPDQPVSFDNPPQRIKPEQKQYDALAFKADMQAAPLITIPENWDLSEINTHSERPHYYQGNNYIPNTALPKGSIVGSKCDIEGAIVLENVRVGLGSKIGDGAVVENSVLDDFIEMGDNVYLKNTEIGNGFIAVCIEEMSGCKVGYNFDCHSINHMGRGNIFHRDMTVQKVGRMEQDNMVRTVSNDTEPLQIAELMEDEHSFALNHV